MTPEKTPFEKTPFEKTYGYKAKDESDEQKATREKFTAKHGYARHDETDTQKVSRIMTNRLSQFVKVGNALETLGRNPYKATENQRAYCSDTVSKVTQKVIDSMEGSSVDEGEKIEVPA